MSARVSASRKVLHLFTCWIWESSMSSFTLSILKTPPSRWIWGFHTSVKSSPASIVLRNCFMSDIHVGSTHLVQVSGTPLCITGCSVPARSYRYSSSCLSILPMLSLFLRCPIRNCICLYPLMLYKDGPPYPPYRWGPLSTFLGNFLLKPIFGRLAASAIYWILVNCLLDRVVTPSEYVITGKNRLFG